MSRRYNLAELHGGPLDGHVVRALIRGLLKSRVGIRVLTLPRPVVELLTAHLAEHVAAGPESLVFTGDKGAALRRSNFNRTSRWPERVAAVGGAGAALSTTCGAPTTCSLLPACLSARSHDPDGARQYVGRDLSAHDAEGRPQDRGCAGSLLDGHAEETSSKDDDPRRCCGRPGPRRAKGTRGARRVMSAQAIKGLGQERASDLGLCGGASDGNRTRTVSLGSVKGRRARPTRA
jgi:hypothetical protein